MQATEPPFKQLKRNAEALFVRQFTAPRVGLVLGSGLGAFADTLASRRTIPYAEIDGMPRSGVAGHAGNLVCGKHAGMDVVAMQGRVHLYEGHTPAEVVFGVRLMVALGARVIVLTNAAGGIRDSFAPGDLMLIDDQLNLTGRNCLLGPNDPELGPRFPPMDDAYDDALADLAVGAAAKVGVELPRGVYAGVLGPSYETAAEIRMLRTMGADAVGMSTVQEAIAARHMGARCIGISCITNRAAGLPGAVLDHDEVQEVAARARTRFASVLGAVLDALAQRTDGETT